MWYQVYLHCLPLATLEALDGLCLSRVVSDSDCLRHCDLFKFESLQFWHGYLQIQFVLKSYLKIPLFRICMIIFLVF